MRNGFTKALAAVAIACMSIQAYAVAPVINAIPNPVVTDDANPVTGSYLFVYADFINLGAYTSDDGDVNQLVWGYTTGSGIRYGLNGATELGLVDPRGDLLLATPSTIVNSAANIASAPEVDPDGDEFSVTIRDYSLTAYGAASGTPQVGSPGAILGMDTVTLYASDGTTTSFGQQFTAYTQLHGGDPAFVDRLSATPGPPPVNEASIDFAGAGPNSWTSVSLVGSPTLTSTGGICIDVPAGGINIGTWISPYGIIDLVDNSVWRLRATMSTTQNTAGAVPLWDMVIENVGGGASGQAYIADYLFLDNVGSANAVAGPAQGRNIFEAWFTPAAVRAPQWRSTTTGIFQAALDADNDARVQFRILDTDASSGVGGELDSGTICMTNLEIDRFDLDNINTSLQVYNLNPITSGINGVTVADVLDPIAPGPGTGSLRDFVTNPLTISPKDPNGWILELTLVTPGDTNNPALSDPGYAEADIIDNYPVVWNSNTLYEIQVDLSAPDALSENDPPDAFRVGFDTKTNELLGDNFALSGYVGSPAMPKQVGSVSPAGPQTYTMIFNSHNQTLAATPGADRLRYKTDILNSDTYGSPITNAGSVRYHAIRVNQITFFGQ